MTATTKSRATRIVSRITAALDEMSYGSRRVIEVQTGVTGRTRQQAHETRVRSYEHNSDLSN